jgi:tripeptide aminopeptidase
MLYVRVAHHSPFLMHHLIIRIMKTAARTARTPSRRQRRTSADESLDLLIKLLSIPGASGDEQHVARFICDRLGEAGLPSSALRFDSAHRRTPIRGNTGNLILKLPGTIRAPRRLLMAHMDTVPICVGTRPRRRAHLIVSGNPKTGLGADDRAGVATTLSAALHVLRNQPEHPPLTFVWTIQEEIGLHGARLLKAGSLGAPQLAFNWDGGSADRLTIGATGGYRMQIDVRGKASHAGSSPDKGVSAIAIAGIAIADLHTSGWHGPIQKNGKSGTSNIGVIEGGPRDQCRIRSRQDTSGGSQPRPRVPRADRTGHREGVSEGRR